MNTGRRRLFTLAAVAMLATVVGAAFVACNGRSGKDSTVVVKPAEDDLPKYPDGPPFFEDVTAQSGIDFT